MLRRSLTVHALKHILSPIGASKKPKKLAVNGSGRDFNGRGLRKRESASTMTDLDITNETETNMRKSEVAIRERKIAEKLRDYRIESGLSQNALADKSGIDRKTVNRIENNHFSPSIATLIRLCDTLSVKVSEVVK